MNFKIASLKKYLTIALSQKKYSKIVPSKNVFQKHMSNCPLKIALSKNAFQNCYKLSIENKNQISVGLKILDM